MIVHHVVVGWGLIFSNFLMNSFEKVNWKSLNEQVSNASSDNVQGRFTNMSKLLKYSQYIDYANSILGNINENQLYRYKEYLKREELQLDQEYNQVKNKNQINRIIK